MYRFVIIPWCHSLRSVRTRADQLEEDAVEFEEVACNCTIDMLL